MLGTVSHVQETTNTNEQGRAGRRVRSILRMVDDSLFELQDLAVSQIIEHGAPMAVAENWIGDVHVTFMMSSPRLGVWMFHRPQRGVNAVMTESYAEARRGVLALLGVEVE